MPSITPCLWFDDQAQEAAQYYVSLFPGSRVVRTTHYGPDMPRPEGSVLTVEFELDGQRFIALNGGPQFKFDEAVSFEIECPTQQRTDELWTALTADGGEEGRCGWCKDRFGLSWQVVPAGFVDLVFDPDPDRSQRAMQAMMGMRRLDLAELRRAADGVAAG